MPVDLVGRSDILMSEPLGEELDIPNGLEMQEGQSTRRTATTV